jgi:hypothetical protein
MKPVCVLLRLLRSSVTPPPELPPASPSATIRALGADNEKEGRTHVRPSSRVGAFYVPCALYLDWRPNPVVVRLSLFGVSPRLTRPEPTSAGPHAHVSTAAHTSTAGVEAFLDSF